MRDDRSGRNSPAAFATSFKVDSPSGVAFASLIRELGPSAWPDPFLHPTCWNPGDIVVSSTCLSGQPLCSWVLLSPKVIRRRLWRHLQVARSTYRLVGQPALTCDACREALAVEAIAHGRVLYLEEVDESWGFLSDLKESGATVRRWRPVQTSWTISLAGGEDAVLSRLARKSRYNLRRADRLLGGAMEEFRQPEDVEKFLELAHAISERSWQRRSLGVRIRTDAPTVSHFARLAQLSAFRGYILTSTDLGPTAFVIGVVSGGVFRYEEIGFDERAARLSPGSVLLYRLIQALSRDPTIVTLDFGFGDAPYKRQFGGTPRERGHWTAAGSFSWRNVGLVLAKVEVMSLGLLQRARAMIQSMAKARRPLRMSARQVEPDDDS